MKVFTYDELVAEIEQRRASAALAIALTGIGQSMNAANAGYTHYFGTYSSPYGSGSYFGHLYNPWAASQAQAAAINQMTMNVAAIEALTNQALNELNSTNLKKSTVFPQQVHGGYVQLERIRLS